MANVLDTLRERGFLQQITFEDELYELLDKKSVPFYIGFDPTADSLHVGHFMAIMVMAHMQRAGHIPIALMGGGTAMVGDPSGKTDMRKMLTVDEIAQNVEKIKEQFSRFIDFSDGKALMVNNADWLMNLNYVGLLREVGAHFSVNRMLTAECYKQRMEKGLSFLEFNYMIMQAYDFWHLNREYDCMLQMGGDDQWSNILAGADLIRRKEQKPAYACTFSLLLTAQGKKMGKTESGALWLSAERTSPYEFYQYWRNVDDSDVENCLARLTFLPMDEVRRLGALKDAAINEAKKILALEVTKLVHGEDEAKKAEAATNALFGGGGNIEETPTTEITKAEFEENAGLLGLMVVCGLTKSNGEGRRLVQQGGVSVDDQKITDVNYVVPMPESGELMIRKGKKVFHRVVIK
jgi:tyrosyl-tRNA synthetase